MLRRRKQEGFQHAMPGSKNSGQSTRTRSKPVLHNLLSTLRCYGTKEGHDFNMASHTIVTSSCLKMQLLFTISLKLTSRQRQEGDRTKLLPYTNFYVEVLTEFRIKLLNVEVLTNFRIKLLHVEVLAIFPDKTSTLTKLIKNPPPQNSKIPSNKNRI